MMEMNRRYIVYAMMATIVTLSSCAGEESEAEQSPPVPISVTVNSDHQPLTRNDETTPLTDAALQSTGFGLYCQPEALSPIMNNQKFTYSGSAWTYSPLKYWPTASDTKLNFIAYAPYTTDKVSYNSTTPELTYRYTVDTDNPFDNIDLCTAVTPNRTSSGGAVPLTFEHQTARLDVQVGINNATSGSKYFIQSVSIVTNSHNPETLHVGLSGDPSWTAESGASTLSYNISSFPVGIADPGTSLTTENFYDNETAATLNATATRIFPNAKYLTILPSTSSFNITVEYVEYSVSATPGLVESTVRTHTSPNVALSDVTGGHRYTLNITLDPLNPSTDPIVTP